MKVVVWGFGHFANVLCCALERSHCRVRQEDLEPHLLRVGQPDGTNEPSYRREVDGGFEDAPDVIWAAYDVALDAEGRSQDNEVISRLCALHHTYPISIPLVVSAQWRVGGTAKLETQVRGRSVTYVMENVRVGHAITDFTANPLIVGTRDSLPTSVAALLSHFTYIQVLVESAEMAKHALNGFLALNIAYANEIADLCATVGANPAEVMRAVASDDRVSLRAPLRPGAPFGGGSLMRDVLTLEVLAARSAPPTDTCAAPVIMAILTSNARPREAPTRS